MNKALSTLSLFKVAAGLALALQFSTAVAAVAPITVQGNKVLFGGQPGSVSGISMFWSNTLWGGEKYYNAQAVSWLKSDWNAKLVRAAMGVDDKGGYITDATNKTRATTIVDAAIANDMYVIIDWHSHHAEQYQAQSIAFFQEMATKYGNNSNVIYEIYNEPLQVSWSGVIKPYATAVIKAIRAIDPDNLIIVGTPSWSQDVDVAANDPITGYANIAYTLHFYAGTHGQFLRDKASTAMNRGIALFVTEWGSVNANGDGAVANSETNAWVSFMKANNLSNANWSLTDKLEGAAALVAGASATGGWVSSQLTASGALAKSITQSWPALAGGGNTSVAASSKPASSIPASSKPASSIPASSKPASSTPAASKSASSVAPASSRPASSAPASSKPASVAASSSSAANSGGISCAHMITNEWNTGFTGIMRITNKGTSTKNGWTVTWKYGDATRLVNSYNSTITGSNPYTATNLSWNASIPVGQSVEFGFQAAKNGPSTSAPTISECK